MKLLSAQPTVFFVREDDILKNRVCVTLENTDAPTTGQLTLMGSVAGKTDLLSIPTGESTHDLYVEDFRQDVAVAVQLHDADGKVIDELKATFAPVRHWEISLLQYSHHDLGYTDLPSHVLEEFEENLHEMVQFCRDTEHWDEDCKFRGVIEQGWSLMLNADKLPEDVLAEVVHYLQTGQLEITALWGNQTAALCGHEEQFRLMYPQFALARDFGVHIDTAMHNDIPGFSWGLISAMASAGVKYLALGLPGWYFSGWDGQTGEHGPWDESQVQDVRMPGPWWWEGPDGQRVLTWYNFHGHEMSFLSYAEALNEVPTWLGRLTERGYAYDEVCMTVRGGHRDNAPLVLNYAHAVREWNNKWEYPRLINSTNSRFFTAFEAKYGDSIKTLRGELSNTDYTLAAACTPRETAVDLATHEQLMSAEKLATVASLVKDTYVFPEKMMNEAWELTFCYDLHCWGMASIGGPSHDGCFSEKGGFAYKASAIVQDVIFKASNAVCDQIAYDSDDAFLTVFNPLGMARSEVVRAGMGDFAPCGTKMFWTHHGDGTPCHSASVLEGRWPQSAPAWMLEEDFELVDVDTGTVIPHQVMVIEDPHTPQPWAPERVGIGVVGRAAQRDVVFIDELPAMGYKTYKIVKKGAASTPAAPAQDNMLENDFYRITLDLDAGKVLSIVDKELDRELLDTDAPHGFGDMVVRTSVDLKEFHDTVVSASIVEAGPIYTVVRFKGLTHSLPQWTKDLTLYHTIKRIDLNVRMLKDTTPLVETYMAFPFKSNDPNFRFEGANSVIEPTVDQLPGSNTDYYATHHWADVSDDTGGITWAPIDTHMVEFGRLWGGSMSAAHHGATGPAYGHDWLKPGEFDKGHIYSFIAYNNFRTNFINVRAGDVLTRYAMTSHEGDWQSANASAFGWSAANPPVYVWMNGAKPGTLPTTGSFASVSGHHAQLTTIKPAEDGNGLALRLVETLGVGGPTTVTLPQVTIYGASLTDAVELDPVPIAFDAHSVTVDLVPFGSATIQIQYRDH